MGKFNLDYIINLVDNNFNSGMKKAVSNVGELDNKVSKVNKNIDSFTNNSTSKFKTMAAAIAPIGGLIAGAFAVNSIINFSAISKQAYLDQVQANAQLRASLISTGGIAGKTYEDLINQANKLQNTTLFPDEMTIGAQSLLLTFTKVRGEIFDKAIPAIQDIATKMAGGGPADLKGAAIQVGKALNDPIAGISALQRVGVSFSEQQKNTIKTLVETGNIQKAQTIILKELNTEFGGSSEAARKAINPIASYKVAIEELKEQVGQYVIEAQSKLAPVILQVVEIGGKFVGFLSSATDWVIKNKTAIAAISIGLGTYATALLLVNTYKKLNTWYNSTNTAAVILNTLVTEGASAASVAFGLALEGVNVALRSNPIGAVITALSLAAAGFYYAYQKSESFRAAISGIGEVVSTVFDIIKETFGKFVSGFSKILDGDIVNGLKDIGAGIVRSNPVGLAMTEGKRLGDAYKKGYNESIQKTASEKAIKDAEYITKKRTEVLASKGLNAQGGVVDINLVKQNFKLSDFEKNSKNPIAIALRKDLENQKTNSLSTSSGSSESVSSGNAVRNIRVDFDSIIKNLTINTQNVKDGVNDIRKIIEEEFVKIVRDAELTLSNE